MARGFDLMSVQVVTQRSADYGRMQKAAFQAWLREQGLSTAVDALAPFPDIIVPLLHLYGRFLFASGASLSRFRHLLAGLQREHLRLQGRMPEAWDLVTRWQVFEPVSHRVPLPRPLCLAMAATALLWGWPRWAGTLLLAFFSVARIGEVLRPEATRHTLQLPSDGLWGATHAFLRIDKPKTRYRGGAKVQHASVTDPEVIRLLESIFGSDSKSTKLYPWSAPHFRKLWMLVLKALGVPKELGLTPGGVRGGGAVALYTDELPLLNILWRMRLSSVDSLGHYLQEVVALNALQSLDKATKNRVLAARALLPGLAKLL